MTSFLWDWLLVMVMFLTLQLMYACVVTNQGIPKIIGYPFNLDLVWRTKKSVGYTQESIERIVSSNIPLGFTFDLSASWSTMGVSLKDTWRFNINMVSLVIKFIEAPKSVRVFWIKVLLMCTLTKGIFRSKYLGTVIL